jgi:Flp pilus assembly protein TadG
LPLIPSRVGRLRRRHKQIRSAGQSLAEFAIVLPILFGLLGATLDLARVYEVRVKLEGATRDAAEFAAMNATTQAEALTMARRVVCLQFDQPEACTSPSVSVLSYSRSTSSPGAPTYPFVSVRVQTTTTFTTLYPYGVISAGSSKTPFSATLTTEGSFAVLQGR